MSAAGLSRRVGRGLWHLLRHDIGRKLTALAFALVLWTTLDTVVVDERAVTLDVRVVPTREEAADKRAIAPALYLVVPEELLVRELSTERVTLHVRGIKDDVRNLSMSAVMEFEPAMLGGESEQALAYRLDRDVFKPAGEQPRLTDFRVRPETLSVTLAPRLVTDVTLSSLNVTTEGRPKDGYFFQESRIVVRPNQVRLSGPSAVIAALRDDPRLPRLAPVRLEGRSSMVSQFVGLPAELLAQGVTLLTPEQVVEVTIFLEAEDVTRELYSVPVTYRNEEVLRAKKQRVASAPRSLDLRLTGPPAELSGLTSEELTKRIDLQYDWRDATLDRARPKVRIFKHDLSGAVTVRLLADGNEPWIEYLLEELDDFP